MKKELHVVSKWKSVDTSKTCVDEMTKTLLTLFGSCEVILGTSGDHLGNRFDEVIGFITDPDLPECADRSVSSSEYRWSEN